MRRAPPEFEPGTSAIVRVEAGRLRKLLMEYAVDHGRADPLVLEIPKGSYVPLLRARLREPEPAAPAGRQVEGLADAQPQTSAGSQGPAWSAPAERRQITVLSCGLGDKGGTPQEPASQELLTSFDIFHATFTPLHAVMAAQWRAQPAIASWCISVGRTRSRTPRAEL